MNNLNIDIKKIVNLIKQHKELLKKQISIIDDNKTVDDSKYNKLKETISQEEKILKNILSEIKIDDGKHFVFVNNISKWYVDIPYKQRLEKITDFKTLINGCADFYKANNELFHSILKDMKLESDAAWFISDAMNNLFSNYEKEK